MAPHLAVGTPGLRRRVKRMVRRRRGDRLYEYLEDMWRSANSFKRPPTIARDDAFIGPFADVFLHEAGHALFDLLKIPLLGREEDAADQLAGLTCAARSPS